MSVNIGVVLANLADEGLCLILRRLQEGLFSLENFLFDTFGGVNVKHTWQGHKNELFVMRLRRGQANGFAHRGYSPVYFAIESPRILVINDSELGVAYPRVNQFSVKSNCFFNCLVACLVVCRSVEFHCTIRRGHHVYDGLIASIT